MGTCLYLAAACVPDRSPTSGSTAHATCGEGRPARNRGNPIRRPEPRSQGPVGSRRGRPASRRRAEPTSLGTEWRCGDPSAGTAGQATRFRWDRTRAGSKVKAWCWTREGTVRRGPSGHRRGVRPMPGMRLACESVAVNVPALLAAIAVGGTAVAVAARPISAFARQYVADLEQAEVEAVAASSEGDEESEESEPAQDADSVDEAPAAGTDSSPGKATFEPTTFRVRWLLTPASQGVLATVLCGLTLAWGALSEAWGEVIVALPIVALLGAACSVDAVCHRLPNRILGPASLWAGAATLALLVFNVAMGAPLADTVRVALQVALCAACAGAVILAIAILIPWSGMGLGDAKLCAVLGLWLGYFGGIETATGIILGFFVGGIVAIALMIGRLVGRKTLIAFGPYLAVGGWLSWMLTVA